MFGEIFYQMYIKKESEHLKHQKCKYKEIFHEKKVLKK